MDLAQVIESYGELLEQRYHQRMLPSHHRTLNAIMACRKDCLQLPNRETFLP